MVKEAKRAVNNSWALCVTGQGMVTGQRDERKEKGGGCRAPSTQKEGKWREVTTLEKGRGALSLGSAMPTLCDSGQMSSLCLDFLLMTWDDLRPMKKVTRCYKALC